MKLNQIQYRSKLIGKTIKEVRNSSFFIFEEDALPDELTFAVLYCPIEIKTEIGIINTIFSLFGENDKNKLQISLDFLKKLNFIDEQTIELIENEFKNFIKEGFNIENSKLIDPNKVNLKIAHELSILFGRSLNFIREIDEYIIINSVKKITDELITSKLCSNKANQNILVKKNAFQIEKFVNSKNIIDHIKKFYISDWSKFNGKKIIDYFEFNNDHQPFCLIMLEDNNKNLYYCALNSSKNLEESENCKFLSFFDSIEKSTNVAYSLNSIEKFVQDVVRAEDNSNADNVFSFIDKTNLHDCINIAYCTSLGDFLSTVKQFLDVEPSINKEDRETYNKYIMSKTLNSIKNVLSTDLKLIDDFKLNKSLKDIEKILDKYLL